MLPFQQYFEEMPCYLTVQDRNLRVITANRRFREHFGDYDGRYCFQVYKNRPEKCEVCPVEKTFHDGQRHSSEEQVRCLNGECVSVIVYTTPIRNERGDITAVMEMSTDITEIKGLQKQLRESQNHYRLLFEESPCFISIQDEDLRIVDANRLHRESFGSYYGCKCYEVYKHRTEECTACTVRQTYRDGEVHFHEEVVTSQSGEPMNVLVHTAPIYDADGKISKVIEMSTDITAIRELKSQLTSIGLLISSISHGIKGLLNGLNGGIYLVNQGLSKDNPARIKQGWDIVLRNVDRIRSMVLDILYYAKDRELNLEPTDPAEVVDEIHDLLAAKAAKLQINWVNETADHGDSIDLDRRAIRALLVNLAENSLDACRVDKKLEKHQVVFAMNADRDGVSFKISDNGIGMDRETRDKAFSLFFSSKGTEGTGLGLYIANKIARSHGGTIRIDSEVDRGTTFTVRIPR